MPGRHAEAQRITYKLRLAVAHALERHARGELDGADLGEAARSIHASTVARVRLETLLEGCQIAGFFLLDPLDLKV